MYRSFDICNLCRSATFVHVHFNQGSTH